MTAMSDRARKLREDVVSILAPEGPQCPYCEKALEPEDIRADFKHYVHAIVAGRITWETVDALREIAAEYVDPPSKTAELIPVIDFLSDMLEAAGVPRQEEN